MAEIGRIQPQKRPTPAAMAQLPGHIQARFDDPNYDVRKDPEAMGHLISNSMGKATMQGFQNVAAASAKAKATGGSAPSAPSTAPGVAPGTPLRTSQQIATGHRPPGSKLRTAAQIAQDPNAQSQRRRQAQAAQPIGGPQQPQPAPSPFAPSGLGRYMNRNASGLQFNKPAVKSTVEKGLNAYATAQFYRKAGLAEGVRGFLGLPPTPSHMNDWIRSHQGAVTGIDPQAMHF